MKKLINISVMLAITLIVSFSCSKSDDNPVSNNFPPVTDEAVIFNPAVGELWKPGNEYEIKWSYPGSVKEVNITLLKKKQYNVLSIQNNAVNSGIFTWKIPADIAQSVSYQIKIENSADPKFFFFGEVFEISSR